MNAWLSEITTGLIIFSVLVPLVSIIIAIRDFIKKDINYVRFALDVLFVAYMLCVFSLVFFPLPDEDVIANMTGYHGRFFAGSFIFDIAKEKSLTSVLQVIFNIVMTIPFGAYLTYRFELCKPDVVLLSFLLTLFIEVGQLTGLFFIYPGSYRIFDVDDLFLNTFGGFLGYCFIERIGSHLRGINAYRYEKKSPQRTSFNYHL